MENIIIILILLLIVGFAARYVIKAKKSGRKCIGCPDGCCQKKGDGSACTCCCGHHESEQNGI